MNSLAIAGIVFACTFSGALLGMYLRRILPKSHLSGESKDVLIMGTGISGLIATLSALVLGLLIASAKSSFDGQTAGFQQLSVNLILLDRSLKFYGPETQECRAHLRSLVTLLLDQRWPKDGPRVSGLDSAELSQAAAAFVGTVRDLKPKTDFQKTIQSQALQIVSDLGRTRWTLSQAKESTLPVPFLVVLILWLSVLFTTFGLFSPPNATIIAILLICAVSVAGALFLIVELDHPFDGVIQISAKPLRDALGQLGQ